MLLWVLLIIRLIWLFVEKWAPLAQSYAYSLVTQLLAKEHQVSIAIDERVLSLFSSSPILVFNSQSR